MAAGAGVALSAGVAATGVIAGALAPGVGEGARAGAGEVTAGGGVGVCPSAVQARAIVQKLRMNVFFILVVCNVMQGAAVSDSAFSAAPCV